MSERRKRNVLDSSFIDWDRVVINEHVVLLIRPGCYPDTEVQVAFTRRRK